MSFQKTLLTIAFLGIFVLPFLSNVPKVQAITANELRAQIDALMAQLKVLQQQLAELEQEKEVWCYDFHLNMKFGMAGTEVRALQTALQKEGFYKKTITGDFDEYTASAVVGFQEKYKAEILTPWGLEHGTGYIGRTTLAKLNALYGCGVVKPYVKVISPNGGEKWVIGNTYTIKWSAPYSSVEEVKIALRDTRYDMFSESPLGQVVIASTQNTGSYIWTIPTKLVDSLGRVMELGAGNVYKIAVYTARPGGECPKETCDESDNYFSIVSASVISAITVISPSGGETWKKGGTYEVKILCSQGVNKSLNIVLYNAPYTSDRPLLTGVTCRIGETSLYDVTIPDDPSVLVGDKYKIRVDTIDYSIRVLSDGYFSIVAAEKKCISEGQKGLGANNDSCCEGLTKISNSWASGDACVAPFDTSFICSYCGNGVCGIGENTCNCPTDCKKTENLPPVIDGITAPTQLKVNEQGTWTVKAHDPENGPLTYSVDWGDALAVPLPSLPTSLKEGVQTTSFTHSYSKAGTYTITFTITDNGYKSAKTSTTVKVVEEAVPTCSDSDGGLDYYVKGVMNDGGKTYADVCAPSSASPNTLWERACTGSVFYDCPYGCQDGACLSLTDLEIKSVTKGDFDVYGFYMEVCVHGSKSMNDLEKEIPGLSGFPFGYEVIDTAGGRYYRYVGAGGGIEDWKNGKCGSIGWTIQTGEQSIFDKSGQVEVILDPDNLIKETNENNNRFLYKRAVACTDSDGGKDYYTKGTVKDEKGNTYSDYCSGAFAVREYFCSDGKINSEEYICDTGCEAGVCMGRKATNALTADKITGVSVTNYAYPVANDGYIFVTKGEEKNYAYGSRLAQLSLKDGGTMVFEWEYHFANESAKTWYYQKYGQGAKPNHLSVTFHGLVPPFNKELVLRLGLEDGSTALVYLPKIPSCAYQVFYIDKDGSTYYARKDHGCGYADLSPEDALVSQHLAKQAGEQVEEKSITVISPNGGEKWMVGNTYDIQWAAKLVEKVIINITDYTCSSELAKTVATQISASQGRYSWTIPNDFFTSTANTRCLSQYGWQSGDNFKIFVAELKPDGTYGVQDESNSYFNITQAVTPACTDSDGGKDYYVKGEAKSNDPNIDGRADCCKMNYSTDMGDSVKHIGPGGGPCVSEGPYLYEAVCENNIPTTVVYSCSYGCQDGACKKGITVTSPNGGEKWEIGKTYEIKWTASGVEKVILYLYDYAGTVGTRALVYNIPAPDGKYSWTISSEITPGEKFKIAVRDSLAQQQVYDLSNNYFSIVSATTTDCPVPSSDLSQGYYNAWISSAVHPPIGWQKEYPTFKGFLDMLLICNQITGGEYLNQCNYYGLTCCTDSDGGKDYDVKGIVKGIWQASGKYEERIDACDSSLYGGLGLVENYCYNNSVWSQTYSCPYGCQDGACKKGITVSSPNGGEQWYAGFTYNITWTSAGPINNVGITILENHQRYCDPTGACILTTVAPNTGSYAWSIPKDFEAGDNIYSVKVEDEANPSIYDESDNYFSIIGATQPVGLKDIESQLADISRAASDLTEKIRELLGRY